jgi:6-phospho-3-hexuloisomerase
MNELEQIVSELVKASNRVSDAMLQSAIDVLNAHERVFVYGTGRSGLMLKAFAMRLMQMGRSSYVVTEVTCPSINKGDLLVVGSSSGRTQSVVMAAESAAKQGADLLVISGNTESSLANLKEPDILIESPSKYTEGAQSIQPLGSLFEQMLLIVLDAVILKMVDEGVGSNKAMAQRHASLE